MDKKRKKDRDKATLASVKIEMAEPRMAKSAKIAELNLGTTRIPEEPSTTILGVVGKIIPSLGQSQPEKAHIVVDGADHGYRDLRIRNAFTDQNGDDVGLEKGARVKITVTAKSDPSIIELAETSTGHRD
jgi:hypothetical protein